MWEKIKQFIARVGKDKLIHAWVVSQISLWPGIILILLGITMLPLIVSVLFISTSAMFAKELGDRNNTLNHFCWADILWGYIGYAISIVVLLIIYSI